MDLAHLRDIVFAHMRELVGSCSALSLKTGRVFCVVVVHSRCRARFNYHVDLIPNSCAGRSRVWSDRPPSPDQPDEVKSPNPFNLLLPPALQRRFMFDDLMARRTRQQEPDFTGAARAWEAAPRSTACSRYGACWNASTNGLPMARRAAVFRGFGGRPDAQQPPRHGSGGPIPIHRAPLSEWGPVDLALRKVALAEGYPWHDGLNAPKPPAYAPSR